MDGGAYAPIVSDSQARSLDWQQPEEDSRIRVEQKVGVCAYTFRDRTEQDSGVRITCPPTKRAQLRAKLIQPLAPNIPAECGLRDGITLPSGKIRDENNKQMKNLSF